MSRANERLPFAARKGVAFGNRRFVPLGKPSDKGVGKSRFRRLHAFFVGRLRTREAYVFQHRSAEQIGILHHRAHVFAQRAQGIFSYVFSVDGHASAVYVVKAAEQVDDGRLSRTRRAHERNRLPRVGAQRKIFEHGYPVDVRKINVLKFHVAAAVFKRHGVFAVADFYGRVDRIVDAFKVGGQRKHVGDARAYVAQTARDLIERRRDRHEGGERQGITV